MTRIRFQKIKALVLSVIVLLFVNNIAVANEKVTISIDGESYSRDIPEDYDAVVKLLQYVAELERNADLQAFEVSKKYDDSMNSYEKQISELYTEINSLKLTLDQALKDADKTEKDINKLTKTNTRFTASLNVGPIFSYDTVFITGVNTGIILDYRILRNFHIGGNIFLNSFSTSHRPFELGFGLVFGYSLY